MINVSYTALEQSSLTTLGIQSVSFNSGNTSFFSVISFLMMLSFIAVVGVASIMIVKGGMLRMKASEESIRSSNEVFRRVVFGVLGVFSLFIIITTINSGLITGDIDLGKLRVGSSVGTPSTATKEAAQPPAKAANAPSTGSASWTKAIQQDPEIRAQLKNNSISVNKPACTSEGASSCTTVGGLHKDTIDMLISLRKSCSGEIEITGGTENGHRSHGIDKTPVDLSIKDGTLNACIEKFSTGPNVGTWCKRTFTSFGYIFCDENSATPHWHVYK